MCLRQPRQGQCTAASPPERCIGPYSRWPICGVCHDSVRCCGCIGRGRALAAAAAPLARARGVGTAAAVGGDANALQHAGRRRYAANSRACRRRPGCAALKEHVWLGCQLVTAETAWWLWVLSACLYAQPIAGRHGLRSVGPAVRRAHDCGTIEQAVSCGTRKEALDVSAGTRTAPSLEPRAFRR